jgi:hypothetical protein
MPNDNDGISLCGDTNRRRFLKALDAVGVVGLAGCVGDDGDETPTDTETRGNGNGNGNGDTPTATETATETETETPADQPLGDDPSPLLEMEGGSLQAGESTILSGTLTNPYSVAVQNVEVTMQLPGHDWEVSATGATQFDTIDPGASEDVGWNVTAPRAVEGEFSLLGSVSYETSTDAAEVFVSVPFLVLAPPQEDTRTRDEVRTDSRALSEGEVETPYPTSGGSSE